MDAKDSDDITPATPSGGRRAKFAGDVFEGLSRGQMGKLVAASALSYVFKQVIFPLLTIGLIALAIIFNPSIGTPAAGLALLLAFLRRVGGRGKADDTELHEGGFM